MDFKSQELSCIRQMKSLVFDPSREIEGSELWSFWAEDCHKLWSEYCQLPAVYAWSSVGFEMGGYLNRLMPCGHGLVSIFGKYLLRNLKIVSALLFSSAGGNQFESSASSLVSQSDWEAVTNQLTTCKSMFFFFEKSQHLLQIMFYMYCRSEHNSAFIYSSVFTVDPALPSLLIATC